MATNPPITIGELADVPAPGSGVKSAWSQEVTNRIVHRFATAAERDAKWPAATAGRGAACVTLDSDTRWSVVMVAAVLTWVPTTGGAWVVPALGGGWVPYGGGFQTARYRKVGDQVYIEGAIMNGTLNAAAFTLPAGFRPPQNLQFAVPSFGVYGAVSVFSTGVVTPITGQVAFMALNCNFGTT